MAKRKKKKETKKSFAYQVELLGIIYILIGILGICGYGPCGELICAFAAFLFGCLYFVFLAFVILIGFYIILKKEYPDFFNTKLVGFYILIIGILMLLHVSYINNGFISFSDTMTLTFKNSMHVFDIVNGASRNLAFENIGGGLIGGFFISIFTALFDVSGVKIIYIVLITFGALIITGISIADVIKKMIDGSKKMMPHKKEVNEEEPHDVKINNHEEDDKEEKVVITDIKELKKAKVVDNTNNVEEVQMDSDSKDEIEVIRPNENYKLPPLNILDQPKKTKNNNQAGIETNIKKLEEVLREFGITGHVVEVTVGPAITQYELELKAGTKLSKLTGINKEISLALAKKDVRIEAPIPGKSTVGIEISNENPSVVYVKEIMEKLVSLKSSNKLMVALGKDILSKPKFCEINKTPHLLVAGATGSGKSVCINCILASILMTAKPDEVKLLLVDPKKVELSVFNGVPHLLAPVVTDPKKASVALSKIVKEMEDRYDIFEEKGVKNIGSYNEMIEKKNKTLPDDAKLKKMPYVVVIVDELADLMLVASKEVEDSIMRITQMARAAGIHLIIATQRPSTDVITGVIKANIPSRISFAVSSGIDSRTILDMTGAEKLLGRGDMLFLPMGESTPTRIQGAWITEEEVKRIVDYTISQQKAMYDEKMLNLNAPSDESKIDANTNIKEEYDDPLYDEIVEFVITSGKASASLLQRRFKLGYNRAARIVDLLEERGIIGPQNGSKPREVLVKLEQTDEE
ncbi:MAG: DNA translocase FtsK [Bacilli bacterium]|nr:DNA translocase FtsK [Bacilli bacterium]